MGWTQDPLSGTHFRPSPRFLSIHLNARFPHALNRALTLKAKSTFVGQLFIRCVVLDLEVEVVQGLFPSHPFRRTEAEHPQQEIDCKVASMGDEGR